MVMDFFEKLYMARTMLSMNQKEAGDKAGISQVTIGILERGERNAIPVAYANFLYKNGIDLNWIFDNKDDSDVHIFRKEDDGIAPPASVAGAAEQTNTFINHQLLETIHLTYTLSKHLEKLHSELSKMKRLNKMIKIKPGIRKRNRIRQNNK
jgi:DNA-binding XRE family transcriptional regulator